MLFIQQEDSSTEHRLTKTKFDINSKKCSYVYRMKSLRREFLSGLDISLNLNSECIWQKADKLVC